MNLVRILLLVFLVYAALKQKSEESRNVILIVTGLLAVCMMNKEGYLVNCDGTESDGNFTTSLAPGTCTGKLLADCGVNQVRDASTGACREAAPPCGSGKACQAPGDCVATGDSGVDRCGDSENWIYWLIGTDYEIPDLTVCNKSWYGDSYCKPLSPSS